MMLLTKKRVKEDWFSKKTWQTAFIAVCHVLLKSHFSAIYYIHEQAKTTILRRAFSWIYLLQ